MYIKTMVAMLILMATSLSAFGQGCGTCDWYGDEYPVCCHQGTEWGWENNQSCIGASTCTDAGQTYSGDGSSDSGCSTGNGNGLSLSNPNASSEAVALFRFINDMYGQKTLTGQQESTWMEEGPQHELSYIQQHTGKQPAVLGLDYIDPDDYSGVNDRATAWYHDRGGIPSIMWHWGSPSIGTGYENSQQPFDLPQALVDGTPENQAMMRDMGVIADQLTVLRDRNVPVLWRPVHEFTGTWFWWGQHGPENFKQLWIKMYEYFTDERGLTNLIWVLPYSGEPDSSYYPGDQYVDIGAADTYVNHNGSLVSLYDQVRAIVGDVRPVALHENGSIPDPQAMLDDGAKWSWFNTWHTGWLTENNEQSWLHYIYNHDHYVTLDELPDLQNYGQ